MTPGTEHRERIIKWPWSLKLDFNQQEGAHQEWKAAGVSCPVLLYTLFLHYTVYYYSCLSRIAPECATHCRYAGDDSGCHCRLFWNLQFQLAWKHQASCIGCQKGWNCAVLWLLFLIMTRLFHLLQNNTNIIIIITKPADVIRPGIHWKNKAKDIRNHSRLAFVANRSTTDSIRGRQHVLHQGLAGYRGGVLRVGLTDVGKPARAHGRAKLIAVGIHSFGNSRPFVLPQVMCNTKVLTGLYIMRIIDTRAISVICDISVISDINWIDRIMCKTFSACITVLNPKCHWQKTSSIKWIISWLNMKIFLATAPLTL